jgi:hypothetical protein
VHRRLALVPLLHRGAFLAALRALTNVLLRAITHVRPPSRPTDQRTRQPRRGRATPSTPAATACSTPHERSGRRLSHLLLHARPRRLLPHGGRRCRVGRSLDGTVTPRRQRGGGPRRAERVPAPSAHRSLVGQACHAGRLLGLCRVRTPEASHRALGFLLTVRRCHYSLPASPARPSRPWSQSLYRSESSFFMAPWSTGPRSCGGVS